MFKILSAGLLLAGLTLVGTENCGRAWASPRPPFTSTIECSSAIAAAEQDFAIPAGLLLAVALTESGRKLPDGRFAPWPYTLNADGRGMYFDSLAEVLAQVRLLQRTGVRNIDMGCLQISSLHHPHAFASLEEAFDPMTNARYGARFLAGLYRKYGSWEQAVGAYHSADPQRGGDYRQHVFAVFRGDRSGLVTVAVERERLQGPLLQAIRQAASNPRAALLSFTAILRSSPADVVALAGRAQALRQMGLAREAYYDLEALYRHDPESLVGWQLVVEHLHQLPPDQQAEQLRRLALALPRDAKVHLLRAQERLQNNDAPQAREELALLRRLRPEDGGVTFTAAQVAEHLGLTDEARSLYQSLLASPALRRTLSPAQDAALQQRAGALGLL